MASLHIFCTLITLVLLASVYSHDSQVINGCNDDVTIKVMTSARDSNDVCAPPRIGKSGPKGEKGFAGEKGNKGSRGDVGLVGAKGEQGVIGGKGEKGEDADVCECITNQQVLDRIGHLEGKLMY